MTNLRTTPDRTSFRLELFSRGGDPRFPIERVFELPCPGLPANARVFGVIRSESPDATSTLASLIRNAIISAQTLNRRTLNSGLDGQFEAMLLAVNRGYAELAASGTLPSSPLPEALMGMIVDNEVFLTGRGAVEAFMFQAGDDQNPRNLFAEGENRGDEKVLFRTILSGTMRATDVMLVTFSSLFDYLSVKHLSKVLAETPAREARTRVLELLGDIPTSICLSGIIIGAPPPEQGRGGFGPPGRAAGPTGKIENKDDKVKLLSVSRTKQVGGLLASGVQLGTAASGRVIVKGGSLLARGGRGFWRFLSDGSDRDKTIGKIRSLPQNLIGRWNGLPTRTRVILVALVLLALLFGESLRFMSRNRAAQDAVNSYNGQVAAIQAKRDAAEASMIYKDEDKAWNELYEAETAAKALPQTDEAQKKTVTDLLAQIEADREKLRHVTRLDDLSALASLPDDAGSGVTVLAGKTLVSFVGDRGGVMNWDIAKRSLSPAVAAFLTDGNIKRAMMIGIGLDYFTGKALLERAATSTSKSSVSLPGGNEATAVQTWNSRVYALSASGKQVYKGAKTDAGWNLSSAVIKSALPDGMADISIDGSVWVAGGSTVKRYLAGDEEAFAMKRMDPAPQAISRIWTSVSGDYVAVYDRDLKRLYLLSKSGDLKTQYAGGPMDDLKDVSIDDKGKGLWILTSRSLFRTELP